MDGSRIKKGKVTVYISVLLGFLRPFQRGSGSSSLINSMTYLHVVSLG
jgi:hypothetical protein